MSLKASYEFLFFGKDDNSFLENYSYDLFQDHGEKSGQIFVNLEVQNNPVDAEEIGAVIFETMQKVFFEDVGRDSYERFEIALKAVNSVLHEFKAQKVSGYIGNLNVIIAGIVDGVLYLSQTGDAEAYLIRKRYVSVVTEGLGDDSDSEDVFTSIASGQIEPGDFVLFSSTRMLRYISKTDLAKAVGGADIIEALNEVRDVVSTEVLGRIGLTGIAFSEMTKGDIEAIEDDVDSATTSVLEAAQSHVASQKGTLTGKFVSAVQGFRRKKRESVYNGGIRKSEGGVFERFWKGLTSAGFGKNKILALLVVVIVVLLVGIVIANSQRAAKEEIAKLDEVLNSVHERIATAETKGAYDKEGARDILDKAYLDAVTVLNSGYYRDKANQYLIQIDQVRDNLDNVQRIEVPEVLVDLTQKRNDVDALGFAVVNDRVFVYEYNALYELVLDQIQDPLTIDDEETVIAATGFGDRNSVVFLTKSGKLIEYKDGTMSFMDTDEGTFRRGVAVRDWSNRIYLLDSTGSQIWKYTYKGTRDAFGAAEPYFSEEVDVTTGVSFAIDANVYVLSSSGEITRYYAGAPADLAIDNAPFSSFKEPKVLYTDEKLDQVFVLDAAEARVIVFDKGTQAGTLTYNTQYLFEGVGELRDMYFDPDSRQLYVLSPSKVYQLGL